MNLHSLDGTKGEAAQQLYKEMQAAYEQEHCHTSERLEASAPAEESHVGLQGQPVHSSEARHHSLPSCCAIMRPSTRPSRACRAVQPCVTFCCGVLRFQSLQQRAIGEPGMQASDQKRYEDLCTLQEALFQATRHKDLPDRDLDRLVAGVLHELSEVTSKVLPSCLPHRSEAALKVCLQLWHFIYASCIKYPASTHA